MKVQDLTKVVLTTMKVVKDGKTVYSPFGTWNPEWDSMEVRWIDASEEGVIVIGI